MNSNKMWICIENNISKFLITGLKSTMFLYIILLAGSGMVMDLVRAEEAIDQNLPMTEHLRMAQFDVLHNCEDPRLQDDQLRNCQLNRVGHASADVQKALESMTALSQNNISLNRVSWKSKFGPFSRGGNYDFDEGFLVEDHLRKLRVVWRKKLSSKLSRYLSGNMPPLYHTGSLYVLDDKVVLKKIDAKNGKLIWAKKFAMSAKDRGRLFSSQASFPTPMAIGNDGIFVTTIDGNLHKMNLENGDLLWEVYVGHPIRTVMIYKDSLVLTTADNLVLVVSTDTGQLLWRDQGASSAFFGGASIYNSLDYSQPLVINNNLVAAFANGSVAAWKMFNGQKMWHHNFSNDLLSNSDNDKILTNTDLFDVDASLVADDYNVYVLSSMEGLFALNYLNGEKIWHLPKVKGFATPWIMHNRLFVLSDNDDIMLLQTDTGDVEWQRSLRDDILWHVGLHKHTSPKRNRFMVGEDRTYKNKALMHIHDDKHDDVIDQEAEWEFSNEKGNFDAKIKIRIYDDRNRKNVRKVLFKRRPYWFSPVVINSKIFLVSHNGLLVILSMNSGQILDIRAIGHSVRTQPVVGNGRLFIVDANGYLLALE